MTREPIHFGNRAGSDRAIGVWSRLASPELFDGIAPKPGGASAAAHRVAATAVPATTRFMLRSTPDMASHRAAIRPSVAQGGGDLSARTMSSADQASQPDDNVNPAIQQVLDAMEAAEISPEDALQISLVLLNFVEEHHLDNLEEFLADEQPDAVSIAVWAADSARLKTARELLEEVLGEDEDDEDAEDDSDSGEEDA